MKLWTRFAMISMMALAIPACTGEVPDESDDTLGGGDGAAFEDGDDGGEIIDNTNEDVGEAEQALCQWNLIMHYQYSDASGSYRWDVSYNYSTGKWYVDERRIGGGFYKQYVLTPDWTECWNPSTYVPETINLKYGLSNLTGPHTCLPDTREEVHLPDKQRVLSKVGDFYEYKCFE